MPSYLELAVPVTLISPDHCDPAIGPEQQQQQHKQQQVRADERRVFLSFFLLDVQYEADVRFTSCGWHACVSSGHVISAVNTRYT